MNTVSSDELVQPHKMALPLENHRNFTRLPPCKKLLLEIKSEGDAFVKLHCPRKITVKTTHCSKGDSGK